MPPKDGGMDGPVGARNLGRVHGDLESGVAERGIMNGDGRHHERMYGVSRNAGRTRDLSAPSESLFSCVFVELVPFSATSPLILS
jgi:hypothetical protein